MIVAKKRNADSSSEKQVKKPKLEKKTGEKKNFESENGAKSKPSFKKPAGKSFDKVNKFQKKPNAKNPFVKRETKPVEVKPEKVDWKKFKLEKKELKLKRKGAKADFDKIQEAKQIYEKLKCKSTQNKEELCRELHKMFRNGDTYQKLVMAHDTARIVQCLLKRSPAEICQEISQILIPIVSKLAISNYAYFCVPRLLKYGTTETKHNIIEAMQGHLFSMISRPKSSSLVDTIYISYASSQQKALMRQELYGDLYKKSKDNNVKCIKDTYKDSPHMKLAIVNAVKSNLEHIANKKLVDNSLVHAVLLDYLSECNEEDKGEVITMFLPHIPALASTKDGVRAAMICFWHSIVKDRRAVLKTIREHLTKLCTHEHGHIFILALVNSMDDTKALKKSIFDPIFAEIKTIISNEFGRKVVEWFVAPADTKCYHPQMISLLEEGLQFSKKDKQVRRAELLEAVEESLCKSIAEDPAFFLRGGHMALTTVSILKNFKDENAKSALDALAEVVCNVDWKVTPNEHIEEEKDKEALQIKKMLEADDSDDEKKEEKPQLVSGVEHAGLHIALKKLLKLTKFPVSLAQQLTSEVIENWLPLNRASFLLLNAYENADATIQQQMKSLVQEHTKLLKSQNHAASKLLIKKMDL